jgi:hypothetical protein
LAAQGFEDLFIAPALVDDREAPFADYWVGSDLGEEFVAGCDR